MFRPQISCLTKRNAITHFGRLTSTSDVSRQPSGINQYPLSINICIHVFFFISPCDQIFGRDTQMLGCNVSKDQRADSDGGDILNDGFVGEYAIRNVFFSDFCLFPVASYGHPLPTIDIIACMYIHTQTLNVFLLLVNCYW